MNKKKKIIAYFVSPHGFGHAARACAVADALKKVDNNIDFIFFTKVPKWFFTESLNFSFDFYELNTDVGLVQEGPFVENVNETVEKLNHFFKDFENMTSNISDILGNKRCSAVICDISFLGINIAKRLGIPGVLIENFTWDWIYENYAVENSELKKFIKKIKEIYLQTDFRIQTEPVCEYKNNAYIVGPISRKPKSSVDNIKEKLGLKNGKKIILITMGGVRERNTPYDKMKKKKDFVFLIPGGSEKFVVDENLYLLPFHSDFYHPDLIAVSDVVVAKAGYSTLAEVYYMKKSFIYIKRDKFKEVDVLEKFIKNNISNYLGIKYEDYKLGLWIDNIEKLCYQDSRNEYFGVIEDSAHKSAEYIVRKVL